jgi:hypothetical protein
MHLEDYGWHIRVYDSRQRRHLDAKHYSPTNVAEILDTIKDHDSTTVHMWRHGRYLMWFRLRAWTWAVSTYNSTPGRPPRLVKDEQFTYKSEALAEIQKWAQEIEECT